jgi:hypothetical protein
MPLHSYLVLVFVLASHNGDNHSLKLSVIGNENVNVDFIKASDRI